MFGQLPHANAGEQISDALEKAKLKNRYVLLQMGGKIAEPLVNIFLGLKSRHGWMKELFWSQWM